MTLDEAIKYAEEVAEEKFNNAVYIMDKMKSDVALENAEECKRCAEDHRQLALWLKELKQLRERQSCEDAISRQAVIDMISNAQILSDESGEYCGYCTEDIDIDSIPPVILQPTTGHWIGHKEHCENLGVLPSGLGAYEWCSNCDCGIDIVEWHRNNYNYCPNCGAKMIEIPTGSEKELDKV